MGAARRLDWPARPPREWATAVLALRQFGRTLQLRPAGVLCGPGRDRRGGLGRCRSTVGARRAAARVARHDPPLRALGHAPWLRHDQGHSDAVLRTADAV